MAILARSLKVSDYRSFPSYSLDLDGQVTVLVGPNAVGKTNLVEALQLLTAGASFRRPAPADLVRAGAERARMALRLEGEGRVVDIACEVVDGKRTFSRNGKRCPAAGVRGVVPSVLFCPDDLDMVKRSAGVRRAALDDFGVQLSEGYADLVATYGRVVEQRNSLLKEGWCTRGLLEAWDDALVSAGASLTVHRLALTERLAERIEDAYARIAPGEPARVRYLSSAAGDAPLARVEGESRDGLLERVRTLYRAELAERADEELRRRMTLVGPHRDEVSLEISGRSARSFASQGQQRSLVLAWKIAEVEVTRSILGRPPLLLLDDVMSELDARRRRAFLDVVEGEVQTVITTTNPGYFDEAFLADAKVVELHGAA